MDQNNVKTAGIVKDILSLGKGGITLTSGALKTSIALAAILGGLGGGTLGLGAALVKNKNPDLDALKKRKRFYDSQIEEMRNTNWLNEVMSAKRKLETAKLDETERTDLENRYRELIGA